MSAEDETTQYTMSKAKTSLPDMVQEHINAYNRFKGSINKDVRSIEKVLSGDPEDRDDLGLAGDVARLKRNFTLIVWFIGLCIPFAVALFSWLLSRI